MGPRRLAFAALALSACTASNDPDAAAPLDGGDCLPGRNCLRPPDLAGAMSDGGAGDIAQPGDVCHKDTDCKGSRICANGSCTDPPVADLAGADLSTPDLTVLDLVPPPPDLWACHVDGDCADPKLPRCDAPSGRCVACLPAADNCAAGSYCATSAADGGPTSYACAPGCKADGDCSGDGGAAACCGHACVDVAGDAKNCGGCGVVCGGKAPACCSGRCADISADDANCGRCGLICSDTCAASKCAMCPWEFQDCNRDAKDGCEVNTDTDVNNCSGCGRVCALPHATPKCFEAECVVAFCYLGFGDCNHVPDDGCETHVAADPMNCGTCGNVCGNGLNCVGGVCK